jgi:hypothetical protein
MHTRYAQRAVVAVRIGAAVISGHTTNVSRGGLCAELPEPLPVETEVAVELQLSFGDGWYSEPLALPGQIAWCRLADGLYQVGITFRRLDIDRAMYLMLFLRYLDPGPAYERGAPPATIDERFC